MKPMQGGWHRALICGMGILLSMPVFGQVPAIQHDGARAFELFAADAGTVLPSASFPYSGSFLLDRAEMLQKATESSVDPGLATFIAGLGDREATAIGARISATYERYVHPAMTPDYSEYLSRVDPLFTLQLSYQLGLDVALFIEVDGIREFQFGLEGDNLFGSSAGNAMALENNFVRQGYLYVREGPFELTFGRQDAWIGPSPHTSILVSPALPFLDALNLKAHLGRLEMTLLVSTLENRRAAADVTIPGGSPYAFDETVILYNTHYFEYDFGFLRAGVAGSVVITRPDNAFQLSDFFPVFSWHNANIKPNNLSLVFDVSATPLKGLLLYGQYGFDDIDSSIFGSADSEIPTIDAGLLGAAWNGGWERFPVSISVEAGYTHYLWGSFLDDVPLGRAIYRRDMDGADQWMPLTSPFGPGARWLIVAASFGTPWSLESAFNLTLVSRNTAASLTGPYIADTAVENAPRDLELRTSLEVRYEPLKWLTIRAAPSFHLAAGDTWFELEAGIRAAYGGSARIGVRESDRP